MNGIKTGNFPSFLLCLLICWCWSPDWQDRRGNL